MYSPLVRIILIGLALIMAWKLYSIGNMMSTYMVLVAIVLIVWGYFRNGTVFLAFQHLKKENYDKAEHLLTKISKPEFLKKSQKSYYHFTKGLIELNKQNIDSAYEELSKALNHGLRTQNDTAIVKLSLASIELKRKNLIDALNFINQTKKLNYKSPLNVEIEKVESEIKAAQKKDIN